MSNNQIIDDIITIPQSVDPVKLLSAGVQIYYPLNQYLQVGILFVPPIGHIKIYIQQEALTEDILIQTKVFEMKVPITISLLFFNLGIAHFYSNGILDLVENLAVTKKVTTQIQSHLEEALRKIKELSQIAR